MEKFAGYGFNKSHAAAYALVAYQTAYSRRTTRPRSWPPTCRSVMDDTDKVQALARRRASRSGVDGRCRPTSTRRTTASSRSTRKRDPLRPGRRSRARAQRAIEAIVAAREAGGPFRDLFDFCRARRQARRQPARGRGAGQGAARSTRSSRGARRCSRRSASRSTPPSAREAHGARRCRCSARTRPERRSHCSSRRATGPTPSGSRTRRPRSASTCRAIRSRRTPPELAPLVRTTLAEPRSRAQERVLVAGIVTAMRVQASRRGKMAFVTLDDGHGSAEIMVYNETFDACARAAARGPARRSPRCKVDAAHDRGRRVAGPAHHRRERLRPRRGAQALRAKRLQARVQRQRVGRAARGDPRAVPRPATSRSPCTIAATASAATSSCPTTGASTSTTRCIDAAARVARAGERARSSY